MKPVFSVCVFILFSIALAGCQTAEPAQQQPTRLPVQPKIKRQGIKTPPELKSSRIVVPDTLDKPTVLAHLTAQYSAFESNKKIIAKCKSLSAVDGEKDPQCECRIVADCPKCTGGPVKCTAKRATVLPYLLELERRTCFATQNAQWTVSRVADDVAYGSCGCLDTRTFDRFVKDGRIKPNSTLARCATERDVCTSQNKSFLPPKQTQIIAPATYKSRGIALGKTCKNLSISKSHDGIILSRKDHKTNQCVVYEVSGHKVQKTIGERSVTLHMTHLCK